MKVVVIAPPLLGEVVASALSPMGHEVLLTDGKNASLALLAGPPADLLVIGESDGGRESALQMCQVVRDNPRWAQTAIYLLCSGDWRCDSSLERGTVDRCFTAPFSPLELLDAVSQKDQGND
ncbi:response regulator transcription factor [Bordetella sputigena]